MAIRETHKQVPGEDTRIIHDCWRNDDGEDDEPDERPWTGKTMFVRRRVVPQHQLNAPVASLFGAQPVRSGWAAAAANQDEQNEGADRALSVARAAVSATRERLGMSTSGLPT